MGWARYWELECINPDCPNREVWEVYAHTDDYGDGSFDLVPISDGPGLNGGSTSCPDCGEEGELL